MFNIQKRLKKPDLEKLLEPIVDSGYVMTRPKRHGNNFTFKENEIYYLIVNIPFGRVLLDNYKNFRELNFHEVKLIVIHHFMQKDPVKYEITTECFEWIAEQLTEVFPTTEKNLWYYRYCKTTVDSNGSSEGVTSKTKKVVLDCLTDPDRSKYDSIDVQNKWRDRYKKRMEDFTKRDGKTYITTPAEYFKTFPCLKDNTAIPMLQSDFNNILLSLAQRKNPVISENDIESYRTLFQEQWPLLSPKVLEQVKKSKICEDFVTKYREILDSNDSANIVPKYTLALLALPLLMTVVKPLKKDIIAKSFILHVQNPSELDENKKKFENDLSSHYKDDIIFYVIVTGDIKSIKKSYVVFNGDAILCKDPLNAVDICSWTFLSDYVWGFLQVYVYKIPFNKSPFFGIKAYQVVTRLIHKLKSTKNNL
uniref:Uncharacterized protein n=1 Tax=Trichogramma kaykai TaxID=54128 RepID=A0ABD2WCJ3_9HYME